MNCIIYGNCQAQYFLKILNLSQNFKKIYKKIEHVINYELIENAEKFLPSSISNADLFIYQPLNNNHDKLSTNYILNNVLKPNCQKISFPYIYNSAIWIFDKKGDYKKIFEDLFKNEYSLESILTKFKNLEIDFNFKNRFQNTMNILKKRELETDIKTHDYILNNFRKKKLFISEPHPTIHVYYHCIIQIFKILNLKNDLTFELASTMLHSDRAYKLHFGLIEKILKTPYDINYYKFEWKQSPDNNWFKFYSEIIKKIYLETFSMNN